MTSHNISSDTASLERQLGEVVGTMRMTVTAVDSLRVTVERLAERAALRADLDSARAELRQEIASQQIDTDKDIDKLKADVKALNQWRYWMAGAGFVLIILFEFFKPILRQITS